jgi:drug/metabolite transporter superfamily protein YnfA
MNPSPEDISAGQKAYQGLRAYQRFRTSQQSKLAVFFNVLTVLIIFMQILTFFHFGNYWMAMGGAAVLVSLPWGWHTIENTKRKNFELIKQLKAKYGPEIYDEIKKEPDSIPYKLFQKSYPRDRQAPPVELP